MLSNIDQKSLDKQQRRVVVVDETNHLVLAGAGSGKTLTIAGKVKYLVERKKIPPESILLISFTKKSAEEMAERIQKKLGIDVRVNTFHKLGLDILSHRLDYRPDVIDNPEDVVTAAFNELMEKDRFLMIALLDFFAYFLQIPKKMDEFSSREAYHEYYKNLDYTTFRGQSSQKIGFEEQLSELSVLKISHRGERVKSLEELQIANFLFLNGIEYKYEGAYPVNTADVTHRQYKPDFYLCDSDIYLEHFGIDENGNLPQYSEIEQAKYKEGMEWKRTLHKTNETKLIETYSYYSNSGSLLDELKKGLASAGVTLKPIDKSQIYQMLKIRSKDRKFIEFKKLILSFLGLFKSRGYGQAAFVTLEDEINKDLKGFHRERAKVFFNVFKPIYHFYENQLQSSNRIDFNDMINLATESIELELVKRQYQYIIIDEYQDISYSRYKLIKAIKEKTKAKLLCVGDDWQSIYRFAGSDISLFSNFEDHFGRYHLSKIEQTYRNSQELIDIAGAFVLKPGIRMSANPKNK